MALSYCSFSRQLKKTHKSLDNNLVILHSPTDNWFLELSLFPLCSWDLESTAHCEALVEGLVSLGKLKAFTLVWLLYLQIKVIHSHLLFFILILLQKLCWPHSTGDCICSPFSHLVPVMALCLT